jgi:hypothetical protein
MTITLSKNVVTVIVPTRRIVRGGAVIILTDVTILIKLREIEEVLKRMDVRISKPKIRDNEISFNFMGGDYVFNLLQKLL